MKNMVWSLDAFLAPLPLASFLSEYWEQKSLFLPPAPSPLVHPDLSVNALLDKISEYDLSRQQVDVIQDGKALDDQVTGADGISISPAKLKQVLAAGASLRLNGAEKWLTSLQNNCRQLSKAFSAPVRANIYYTPANEQGFHPHYDSHDVLVLQLEGAKEWSLYHEEIHLPLRGQVFDPANCQSKPELQKQFTMSSGSRAYIPRGWMHDARALNQSSLHVTFGIHSYCWTDVLIETIALAAVENAPLRRALPAGFATDESSGKIATRELQSVIEKLPQFVNTKEIIKLFKTRVKSEISE